MMTITFSNIQTVKDFVNTTNKCTGDIEVKSDRYVVDGKSIMGLFSLDFSLPVEVVTHNPDDLNTIKDFINTL
jgi:phosphotransferase system HPr-like phosphotransfer protein